MYLKNYINNNFILVNSIKYFIRTIIKLLNHMPKCIKSFTINDIKSFP